MTSINYLIKLGKSVRNEETKKEFMDEIKPFLNNKDVITKLVKNKVLSLYDLKHNELTKDRDFVLNAIKSNYQNRLIDADPIFLTDKEIVIEAIKKGGFIDWLKLLSDHFKNDDDIMLLAINRDFRSLEYATQKYKDNKELILNLKYFELKDVSENLKNDRDVVLKAVSISGENLKYASEKLKNDYEIVHVAVKTSALKTAFQYASEQLRGDVTIAKSAIKNFWEAVYYLSEEGKNNKEIILYAMKKDGNNFNCASETLRSDPQVILAALKNAPDQTVIYYLSKELQEELGTKEPIQFFESKIKTKKIKP